MQKKLLLLAFDKAEIEVESNKVFTRAKRISEQIYTLNKAVYGEKSLSEKYKGITNNTVENINLRENVIEALSKYLGYENYKAFLEDHTDNTENKDKNLITYFKKHKVVIIITFLFISSILIYNYTNRQRWMVWQNDHYVEVDFDVKKYDVNQLKIYKEERIEFFNKIQPTCNYAFFDQKRNAKLWYGKNATKKLEYFTALGLHPETGKTLKPITQYMIEKHICK